MVRVKHCIFCLFYSHLRLGIICNYQGQEVSILFCDIKKNYDKNLATRDPLYLIVSFHYIFASWAIYIMIMICYYVMYSDIIFLGKVDY